jgi:DNA-binding NarL/FixJ family response regulator
MVVTLQPTIPKIRIVIIDDHVLIREGLQKALISTDFLIVAQAGGVNEGLAQIAKYQPELIIVDLHLADGSGLDLIRAIGSARNSTSKIPIVVLTMNDSSDEVLAAKSAGASAYVLKSSPIDELVTALKSALEYPDYFLPPNGTLSSPGLRFKSFGLTARENQILALMPSGLTFKEIASQMFLSQATVKTHSSSIYRKLAVGNRSEAINIAVKNHLLNLE